MKDDVLFDAATGPSVGRNELADKVYTTGRGLTRAEARTLVDQVLEEIVDGLTHDGKVLLTGFGHFAVSAKQARVGRNPRTGEEYPIVARRVVKFRAAAQLRAAVVAGEKREIRARKRAVQARISTRASAARHNEMPA